MKTINHKKTIFRVTCLLLAAFLFACNGSTTQAKDSPSNLQARSTYKIDSVNSYAFEYKDGQPGGVIQFSSDELKMCSLLFAKADMKSGFTSSITQLGGGQFDIMCLTESDHFAMSNIVNTSANMVVSDKSGLNLSLSFRLYSARTKAFLVKNDVHLSLNASETRLY